MSGEAGTSRTEAVTARLTPETLALVDRVAKAHGRSRARFVEEAIRRAAESEAEFLRSLDTAEAPIDRGDYRTQEQMEQWFAERSARRPAG